MRAFESRLKFMAKILLKLQKQELNRTLIDRYASHLEGETHASSEFAFNFLKNHQFIAKVNTDRRSPYKITQEGLKFLEGIKLLLTKKE